MAVNARMRTGVMAALHLFRGKSIRPEAADHQGESARPAVVLAHRPLAIGLTAALSVQSGSTPALLGFSINAGGHLLGRAVIIPWAEIPAA